MALDNNKYKVKNGRETRVQAAQQFHNRELRLSSSRGQKNKNKNSIPKRPGPSRELLLSAVYRLLCIPMETEQEQQLISPHIFFYLFVYYLPCLSLFPLFCD
jgi:hypothetical protein